MPTSSTALNCMNRLLAQADALGPRSHPIGFQTEIGAISGTIPPTWRRIAPTGYGGNTAAAVRHTRAIRGSP